MLTVDKIDGVHGFACELCVILLSRRSLLLLMLLVSSAASTNYHILNPVIPWCCVVDLEMVRKEKIEEQLEISSENMSNYK